MDNEIKELMHAWEFDREIFKKLEEIKAILEQRLRVDNEKPRINKNDLRIESCDFSNSVHITHLPTGKVVECNSEGCVYENRVKAVKLLEEMLSNEPKSD